nr:reverse transcriptase domain-containing protein [Tanacetum cinerariifolium]
VMAISIISVFSNSSEESVGTSTGQVILFGTILTTIPDTTLSMIPPSTHRSPTASGALRRRVMILTPGQPIPHGRPYRYYLNGPVHMMTMRKRVGPLPTYRLAVSHSVDYFSLYHFSSDDSSRDSSSSSSSKTSLDSSTDALSDSASSRSSFDHSLPAPSSAVNVIVFSFLYSFLNFVNKNIIPFPFRLQNPFRASIRFDNFHLVGETTREGKGPDQCSKKVKQKEVGEVRGRAYAIKDTEPKGSNVVTGAGYEVELVDERVASMNTVLKGYALNLMNHMFEIDLMTTELGTFDVIIGMDWLVKHDAVIVCGEKVVRIPYANEMLIVERDKGVSRLKIISCIKAQSSLSSSIPGGIGSSGLKDKSISSIRESLSSSGIGDGEKDSISASELSKTNSSDGRGDELSYNNLSSLKSDPYLASKRTFEKVVKASKAGISHLDSPSDSLGFGTRFSTQDFMNSSNFVAGIVSRCSSPILRESTGSLGVIEE